MVVCYRHLKRFQSLSRGKSWRRSFAAFSKDDDKTKQSDPKVWGPEDEARISKTFVEPKIWWGEPIPEQLRTDHLPNPVRNTEREYFQSMKDPNRSKMLDNKYYNKKQGVTQETLSWLQWEINIDDRDELMALRDRHIFRDLKEDQRYLEERVKAVGPELGAAHFILSRGGAIKFVGKDHWFVKDANNKYPVPRYFMKDIYLEAIDASHMPLTYVAFDNLEALSQLRFLRFNNCPHIDDWCLNRLGRLSHCLEFLEISNCPGVTDNGLSALQSLHKLQGLRLSKLPNVRHLGLLTLLLEDMFPELTVMGVTEEELKPPPWKHRGERRLVKALLGYTDEDKEEEFLREHEVKPADVIDDKSNSVSNRGVRRID